MARNKGLAKNNTPIAITQEQVDSAMVTMREQHEESIKQMESHKDFGIDILMGGAEDMTRGDAEQIMNSVLGMMKDIVGKMKERETQKAISGRQ